MSQNLFIFFICLIFLIFYSISDIKTKKVKNGFIIPLFLIGITIFGFIQKQTLDCWILIVVWILLYYLMWKIGVIGGADTKILMCLVFYMGLIGFPELLLGIIIFTIVFLISGVLYSVFCKFILHKTPKDKLPFVPVITISYILFWLFRIKWLGL